MEEKEPAAETAQVGFRDSRVEQGMEYVLSREEKERERKWLVMAFGWKYSRVLFRDYGYAEFPTKSRLYLVKW